MYTLTGNDFKKSNKSKKIVNVRTNKRSHVLRIRSGKSITYIILFNIPKINYDMNSLIVIIVTIINFSAKISSI